MCTGFTALAEETTKNDSPFSILFQPFTCHFSAISEKENHRDRPWASGQSRPVALRCRRRWYALRPAGEGLKSSQVFPGIFVVSFRWTDLYCKRFGIFGSSELILKWFTWFGGDSALDSKKHILWDERRAFDMQSILGWIAAKSWNRLVIALAKIIYIYIQYTIHIYSRFRTTMPKIDTKFGSCKNTTGDTGDVGLGHPLHPQLDLTEVGRKSWGRWSENDVEFFLMLYLL